MNNVAVSFTTNVRQMTEMFQWPFCLSKKWPKSFSENKTGLRSRLIWF